MTRALFQYGSPVLGAIAATNAAGFATQFLGPSSNLPVGLICQFAFPIHIRNESPAIFVGVRP